MFKAFLGSGLVLADAVVSATSFSSSENGMLTYALFIANAAAALVVLNGWASRVFEGRFGDDEPIHS